MSINAASARTLCRTKIKTMEGFGGRICRYFSDGKGRVLSEEERAKEAVYIRKMERERMEKLKKKLEKEKAEAEKKEEQEAQKS